MHISAKQFIPKYELADSSTINKGFLMGRIKSFVLILVLLSDNEDKNSLSHAFNFLFQNKKIYFESIRHFILNSIN